MGKPQLSLVHQRTEEAVPRKGNVQSTKSIDERILPTVTSAECNDAQEETLCSKALEIFSIGNGDSYGSPPESS